MSEGERVEDFLLGRSQEEGPAESAPTPTKTQATRTQYKEGGEKDSATDDGSVLAQVQKYQLRHQVTAAEGSDSGTFRRTSNGRKGKGREGQLPDHPTQICFLFFFFLAFIGTNASLTGSASIFFPRTILLSFFLSEFDSDSDDEEDYQVFGRMTIKAQSEAFYQVRMQQKENKSVNKSNSAKVLPKFLMKKKTQTLQPLRESNER